MSVAVEAGRHMAGLSGRRVRFVKVDKPSLTRGTAATASGTDSVQGVASPNARRRRKEGWQLQHGRSKPKTVVAQVGRAAGHRLRREEDKARPTAPDGMSSGGVAAGASHKDGGA